MASHFLNNRRGRGLILELTARVFKQRLAADRVHLPEILWLKKLNLQVTIHNHRENRCLYTTEAKQQVALAVLNREETCSIQPHHPVCLTAALRRVVEPIKISTRRELAKALRNRRSRQRTNPQALARLGLALSPC